MSVRAFGLLLAIAVSNSSFAAKAKQSGITESSLQSRVAEIGGVLQHSDYDLVGRDAQARRVTGEDPGYHMFGYFDKSPWSPNGKLLLVSRVPKFNISNRLANNDEMELGLVDLAQAASGLSGASYFKPLISVQAWNMQQGAMAQWLGQRSDRIIVNQRGHMCHAALVGDPNRADPDQQRHHPNAALCSVVVDVNTGQVVEVLPLPIYSIDWQGKRALSINQTRLYRVLPGFGYEPHGHVERLRLYEDDGVWLTHIHSGSTDKDSEQDSQGRSLQGPTASTRPELLLSIKQVWDELVRTTKMNGGEDPYTRQPYADNPSAEVLEYAANNCNHWINTPSFDREGKYISFLYRWGGRGCKGADPWITFSFMYSMETKELWRIPVFQGSHTDFGWHNTLLVAEGKGFFEVRWRRPVHTLRLPAQLQGWGNSHASYAPGSGHFRFMLGDTYPRGAGAERMLYTLERTSPLTTGPDKHKNSTSDSSTSSTNSVSSSSSSKSETGSSKSGGRSKKKRSSRKTGGKRLAAALRVPSIAMEGEGKLDLGDWPDLDLTLIGKYSKRYENWDLQNRVDLHPRWDREGLYACFDSTHEGGVGRQVYVVRALTHKQVLTDADRAVVFSQRLRALNNGDGVSSEALATGRVSEAARGGLKVYDALVPPRKVMVFAPGGAWDLAKELKISHIYDAHDANVYALEARVAALALLVGSDEVEGVMAALQRHARSAELVEKWPGVPESEGKKVSACGNDGNGSCENVEGLDLSGWLYRNVRYDDHVECFVSLGSSETTTAVVTAMIQDGTLLLCDNLTIKLQRSADRRSADASSQDLLQQQIVGSFCQQLGIVCAVRST